MRQDLLIGLLVSLLLTGLMLLWWGLLEGKKRRKQRLKTGNRFVQLLAGICLGISLLIFFSLLHFSSLQAAIWVVSLLFSVGLIRIWREKWSDVIHKKLVVYLPLTVLTLIVALSLLLVRPFGLLTSTMALLVVIVIGITSVALQTDFIPRKNATAYAGLSLLSSGMGIILVFEHPVLFAVPFVVGCVCIVYGICCLSLVQSIKRW